MEIGREQKKERKKTQTNKEEKKLLHFFTSFNEMLSSVGVVLLSSPLFDVFSILSALFIVEFIRIVMCVYLCVFYAYFYEYNVVHKMFR